MSESNLKVEVPTTEMITTFGTHVSDKSNKRIMFSAPFGAGKSTFLNEFFKGHPTMKRITLNPVDYSVSSNEDIFEIIKFDILFELTSNFETEIDLKKEDFNKLLLAQVFAKDKMKVFPLLKLFTSMLGPGGDKIGEVYQWFVDTKKEFDVFSADMKIDEPELVGKYLEQHRLKKGSIREIDDVTAMIKSFIQRIKQNNEDQEIVLIIDDLDRLDPEHVFRLFNVFTAHHDSRTEKNKFDFDRIIFVCDIENIRHMFHHKFGSNVDFTGYIDKFFSKEVFEFNFKRHLKDKVESYLRMNKEYFVSNFDEGAVPISIYEKYQIFPHKSDFSVVITMVLHHMIDANIIKTRNLERFKGYTIPSFEFKYGRGPNSAAYDYPFIVLVYNLRQFFPSYNDLLFAFQELSKGLTDDTKILNNNTIDYIINSLIGYSGLFLMRESDFWQDTSYDKVLEIETVDKIGKETIICLKFERYGKFSTVGVFDPSIQVKSFSNAQTKPDPYHYLQLALMRVLEAKIIE